MHIARRNIHIAIESILPLTYAPPGLSTIPIICHWIPGRRPYSLKRTNNKISEYGLYFTKTKTVYYKVSCGVGVVVGWVLKATVDRGSDPAGALCELPPKGGGGRYKIKLGICMHELVSNAID
jgi:hypothetical protein